MKTNYRILLVVAVGKPKANMINDTSAASHRWEQILQELLRHGEVSVDSLAKNFKVSSATISASAILPRSPIDEC